MQWEYMTYRVILDNPFLDQDLNRNEDWELIQIIPIPNSIEGLAIFKRPKS